MNKSKMQIDDANRRLAIIIKPLDWVSRLSWYASGLALLLILSAYLFEVLMRYFLSSPTSWSNDVIQWPFAAMIMLALPEVTRTGSHIVISFFLEKMTPASRRRVGRIITFIGCIMCLLAAWICFQETSRQYSHGIETLWNHPIPKWWISVLIPFGFTLSGIQMLRSSLLPEPA